MDVINLEVKLFMASVTWGIGLAVLYDCLRIFRRIVKHNKIWGGIEDLFYWVASAILIFRMMYQINDGAIRGFAIAGMVIGMVLYHYSVSEFLVRILTRAVQKGILAVIKTIKFLTKPVLWIARRVWWIFGLSGKIFLRPFAFLTKSLKKIRKQVKIAVVKK